MALGLCYDGSAWHGWQTQPSGRTVQDQVEKALYGFLTEKVPTICAGRTDTGVHALNQVIHFETAAQRPQESWVRGLNSFLPSSISVQWAQPVSKDFHARFSAQSRRYIYVLRNARVRNAYAICLVLRDSPEKSGLIPYSISEWHHLDIKILTVQDEHAYQ